VVLYGQEYRSKVVRVEWGRTVGMTMEMMKIDTPRRH